MKKPIKPEKRAIFNVNVTAPDMAQRTAKELLYRRKNLTDILLDFVFGGWLLMLAMGGLHHQLSRNIPAVGITSALLIELAVWSVIPAGVFGLNSIKNLLELERGYK